MILLPPIDGTFCLMVSRLWRNVSQSLNAVAGSSPVCLVNGASSFCRSPFGSGLLGIVHIVSVTFCFLAALALLDELLLLSPLEPQATRAMAPVTTRAIAAGATEILLRTIFLLLDE